MSKTFLINKVFKAFFYIIRKFVSKGLKNWYLWKFSIWKWFGNLRNCNLEAYFSENKDRGFEPPNNKEGFKKFQSIFFFFQWVFSGSFPERDCFSGWKPYLLDSQAKKFDWAYEGSFYSTPHPFHDSWVAFYTFIRPAILCITKPFFKLFSTHWHNGLGQENNYLSIVM